MPNDPQPPILDPSFAHHDRAGELFGTIRAATAALYPEARIPETRMPKWTPGPWFIGDAYCDDEGHREIPIHAANGRGGECTPASVVLQFPAIEGMQDANARLISAAPTMAEYIKRRSDLGDIDAIEIWEQIVR